MKGWIDFFRSRGVAAATAVLAVQAVCFHVFAQNEREPKTLPLQMIQTEFGDWSLASQDSLDSATAENLKPDDYLYRIFENARSGASASLFIAYFKSQRTGHAPHTPRNCLPGHGWTPSNLGIREVPTPGGPPIRVNHYLVAKGQTRGAVIYWYQTANRAVGNEYIAKLYLIADAIRHGRSDTALVRIIVPFDDRDSTAAENAAEDLAGQVYVALANHFPAF